MAKELAAHDLRWRCPEDWLPADSTAKIEPSKGIIGQARAVRALEFGLSVQSLGFNVFVTGLTGTGRMTAIELHLRPLAGEGEPVAPAPPPLSASAANTATTATATTTNSAQSLLDPLMTPFPSPGPSLPK